MIKKTIFPLFVMALFIGCGSLEDISFKEIFIEEIIANSQTIESIDLNKMIILQEITKNEWDSVYFFINDNRRGSIISELKNDKITNASELKSWSPLPEESYILVFTKEQQIQFSCTIPFSETPNNRKLSFLGYNRIGYYMGFSKYHKSEANFYIFERCIEIGVNTIRQYNIVPKYLLEEKEIEYWQKAFSSC